MVVLQICALTISQTNTGIYDLTDDFHAHSCFYKKYEFMETELWFEHKKASHSENWGRLIGVCAL